MDNAAPVVQNENGLLFAVERDAIRGEDRSSDPMSLVVFKLGNSEWVPTQEDEQEFINDLKTAETTGRLVTRIPFCVEFVPGFHDSPRGLYIFKLGDKDLGWVPSRDDAEEFAKLLAAVDADPGAAVIYQQGLTIERIPGYFERPVEVRKTDEPSAEVAAVA